MSLYYVTLLSAYSIILPFTAAMYRMKAMKGKYTPLLILLSIGFCNEVYSSFAAHYFKTNSLNGNIYVLLEYLMIIWQFIRLRGNYSMLIIVALISIGIGVWVVDNLVLHSLKDNNSIFRIVSSLFIVCACMDKANQLLFDSGPVLFKNTDLLLCLGFFSYFTFKTFVEVFNLYEMPVMTSFYADIWSILAVVNFLTNILFSIAIICIQQKQEYTIPSSRF